MSPASPGKKDSEALSMEKDDDSPNGNLLKEDDVFFNILTFYRLLLIQSLNLLH